jgi:hypothetical protein
MSNEKALTTTEQQAPAIWGDRDEIAAIAKRLRAMLPNGSKLSEGQLYAAAQYAQLTGLDPFASGFYAMPGGGIVQHFAVLVSWAQAKAPYSERFLPLSEAERELEEIEPDAIAWKCYILRDDRADILASYIQAGLPFTEALDFLAAKGIGIVTQADRTDRSGKPMAAPKGWTWPKVAQKRALRNALALSHGKPTAGELRQAAERVHRETPQGRLEVLHDQALQITAQAEAMTVEEHRERRQRNVAMMRGDAGIEDDPVIAETEEVLAMAREEEPAPEESDVVEAEGLDQALEVLEEAEPEEQPEAGQLVLPEEPAK